MAFNIGERFQPPPKSFTILDPGAYQKCGSSKIKPNNAPFLSKCPRNAKTSNHIWTHAIYHADLPSNIPNCSSMMSKRPRFPYEALSEQDIKDILCNCGIQNVCECSSEDNVPKFICQGKVLRRLYKGHPPKSSKGEGLSAPSSGDQGFKVNTDGSQQRLKTKVLGESPPFYDVRVDESTAFYQGCKWSRWTSKRSTKEIENSPGPTDYTLERNPTYEEQCAEAVRSYKRKRSKQLRFIEMVQQRDILEGRPGPATYSPKLLTDNGLKFLGPRAKRFPESTEQRPGPADHYIRRNFDLPTPPLYPCRAKLPEPSFFGVKAQRFKPRKEEGASPATYSPGGKECSFMHCPTAAFGSSSVRFKEDYIEEDNKPQIVAEDEPQNDDVTKEKCPTPTWEFKSKTIRMTQLEKKFNEPSPADLPQPITKVGRRHQLQYTAPFNSSEGRFQPWYDWMPVFSKFVTPGPCYYELEKPRCNQAVCRGPLVRTCRFPATTFDTPAPNKYKVGEGLEEVLKTHNQKLRDNVQNQHKFKWDPPVEMRKLSFEEQESILLAKSIQLLEMDSLDSLTKLNAGKEENIPENKKPKLLRCFLYSNPIPNV